MSILKLSLVLFPVMAIAQTASPDVVIPTGWVCVTKPAGEKKTYQVCSPPAGQQGVPFFVWTREPKTK